MSTSLLSQKALVLALAGVQNGRGRARHLRWPRRHDIVGVGRRCEVVPLCPREFGFVDDPARSSPALRRRGATTSPEGPGLPVSWGNAPPGRVRGPYGHVWLVGCLTTAPLQGLAGRDKRALAALARPERTKVAPQAVLFRRVGRPLDGRLVGRRRLPVAAPAVQQFAANGMQQVIGVKVG
jgi:hypothetical protein